MTKYLVALDDGHGMETAGKRTPKFADGSIMHENEFNRAVINKMDVMLKHCGIDTLLVAPTDKDTSLRERTNLANRHKATLYYSQHANAFDGTFKGKNPSGISTHIYPGSKDSKRLAECVHKYLVQGTRQVDRGIVENNFHVLRETTMPAILVEAAFMDNVREARLLRTDKFREEVATEAVKGICEYLGVKFIPIESTTETVYRVQVGEYSNRGNANRVRERLKLLGYDAIVVASK